MSTIKAPKFATITRREFIEGVRHVMGPWATTRVAKAAAEAVVTVIAAAISSGGIIDVRGLGRFEVRLRKGGQRIPRNLGHGRLLTAPEDRLVRPDRYFVRFKPCTAVLANMRALTPEKIRRNFEDAHLAVPEKEDGDDATEGSDNPHEDS